MGEKIGQVLKKPLYPYLYGLAFIAFKSAQYLPSFSILVALGCFFLFYIISYVVSLLYRGRNKKAYAGICIVLMWVSLLHVVGIAQVLGYRYSHIPTRFYVVFYITVLFLLIAIRWWCSLLPEGYAPAWNKLANSFLLTLSLVFVVYGYINGGWKKDVAGRAAPVAYQQVDTAKRKDIIWILMDEYASSASLERQFAFHNPLDSVLETKGFCVLKTMRTRFNNTLFSLNAVFNQDDSVKPESYYAGVDLLKQSLWASWLDTSGYEFINLGFFDFGTHKKLADRSGYPQVYLHQLLSGTFFSMMYIKFKNTIQKCDDYNQEVLHRLNDTLSSHSNRPGFIWAHLGIPHEPYCRNARGELLKDKAYDESDTAFMKSSYLQYLQYGNSVLLRLLKMHPEFSQKILIISGDHGPRYSFLKDKSYQYWPFAAVRMPEKYDTVGLRKLQYISQLPGFLTRYMAQ